MPGFVTHHLFGVDAYKRMNHTVLRDAIKDNPCTFSLGLEGPDLFFYYATSYLIHEKNIGNLAHEVNTNTFFKNLIEGRNLFSENDAELSIADAYICGFLGHYTLDTMTHPFVYAFTGYDPDKKKQPGYFGKHTYYETDMDNELLWLRKKIKPSEFRQDKVIHLSQTERRVVAKLLCYTYNNTYPDLNVKPHMIKSAISFMRAGTKILNDPTGQKKVAIRFAEDKLFGHAVISSMFASDKYQFTSDPFNYAHKTWTHPWTKKASSASFIELYDEAGKLFDRRLNMYLDMMLHGFTAGKKKLFLKEYGNRSFTSGLNQASME